MTPGQVIRQAREKQTPPLTLADLANLMTELRQQDEDTDREFTFQQVYRIEAGRLSFKPPTDTNEPLWYAARVLRVEDEVRRALGL